MYQNKLYAAEEDLLKMSITYPVSMGMANEQKSAEGLMPFIDGKIKLCCIVQQLNLRRTDHQLLMGTETIYELWRYEGDEAIRM